ncbi:MAG: DUF3110 domain-containing protein [Leptolyngbyaceae cyanobacterium bins.59]|nr:DUF3110 domain-containing protein [Leptolyngbyaceae cyanobacterium bins.59]
MRVFVILFNARTENEGIYSVKLTDPEGQDHNVVLMFESEDDAIRYSLMLEAQDFPPSTIEAIESEEVEEFCAGAGFECELVAEGELAVPPESNVDETDWQPETKTPEEISAAELERIRRRLEGLL